MIRHVSDRIAVMYLGKIVELGPADEVYSNPIHPYTLSLLSALPIPDPQVNAAREPLVLEGDLPSPANPPAACRFHTRCPYATEICSEVEPELVHYGNGHWAACHHPLNREHPEAVRAVLAEARSPRPAEPRRPDRLQTPRGARPPLTFTLAIVLVFTEAVLLARGRFVAALALAVIALPVLVFAARRQRNS